jgi:hypothetical protein
MYVFSRTIECLDMQPNDPETTPLMLELVQIILLACLVVSLLPDQANKRVNFQQLIHISQSQDIREHMICSNAALLRGVGVKQKSLAPFLMAGRST